MLVVRNVESQREMELLWAAIKLLDGICFGE